MMRAFDRYIIAEPIASLRSSSSDGHGDVPNQVIDVSLAPMWKFTGMACSAHASQNGSHSGSPRSGRAAHLRVAADVDAAQPVGRGAAAPRRSTPSTSHHGMSAIGSEATARLLLDLDHARRCRASRTGGGARGRRSRRTSARRSRRCSGRGSAPRCPSSSMTSSRAAMSYDARWISSGLQSDEVEAGLLLAVAADDARPVAPGRSATPSIDPLGTPSISTHVGHAVGVGRRCVAGPEVERLGDVGVDVDDAQVPSQRHPLGRLAGDLMPDAPAALGSVGYARGEAADGGPAGLLGRPGTGPDRGPLRRRVGDVRRTRRAGQPAGARASASRASGSATSSPSRCPTRSTSTRRPSRPGSSGPLRSRSRPACPEPEKAALIEVGQPALVVDADTVAAAEAGLADRAGEPVEPVPGVVGPSFKAMASGGSTGTPQAHRRRGARGVRPRRAHGADGRRATCSSCPDRCTTTARSASRCSGSSSGAPSS